MPDTALRVTYCETCGTDRELRAAVHDNKIDAGDDHADFMLRRIPERGWLPLDRHRIDLHHADRGSLIAPLSCKRGAIGVKTCQIGLRDSVNPPSCPHKRFVCGRGQYDISGIGPTV
jgi:hypothetical protein